jgi:high-affinity iron transporter
LTEIGEKLTVRKTGSLLLTSITLAALTLAACGDDESDSGSGGAAEEAAAVTPQKAIAEIAVVRTGLEDGLAAYRKGDQAEAEQLVGDAYLEHFELVEGPLERRDEELNEELEELIRETLRDAISEGAAPATVAALVARAQSDLDEAERALAR